MFARWRAYQLACTGLRIWSKSFKEFTGCFMMLSDTLRRTDPASQHRSEPLSVPFCCQ